MPEFLGVTRRYWTHDSETGEAQFFDIESRLIHVGIYDPEQARALAQAFRFAEAAAIRATLSNMRTEHDRVDRALTKWLGDIY